METWVQWIVVIVLPVLTVLMPLIFSLYQNRTMRKYQAKQEKEMANLQGAIENANDFKKRSTDLEIEGIMDLSKSISETSQAFIEFLVASTPVGDSKSFENKYGADLLEKQRAFGAKANSFNTCFSEYRSFLDLGILSLFWDYYMQIMENYKNQISEQFGSHPLYGDLLKESPNQEIASCLDRKLTDLFSQIHEVWEKKKN